MRTEEMQVHQLSADDLKGITDIHLAAFPSSALTQLGRGAVGRYYLWLLEGPHDAIALGATLGAELVGFCFGGIFRGATSGFLHRNRLYLTGRLISHPWLALNPMFRERLTTARRLLLRRRPAPAPAKRTMSPSFGILSIAVRPQRQGLGVGHLLMRHSEEVARQRGFDQMNLSVHIDNRQAIRFYEGHDWEKWSASDGVWRGEMRKSLHV